MIRRMLHTLRCLFRRDCPVFQGDDFTRWLDQQYADSARAEAVLRHRRMPFEDDFFPQRKDRPR